MKKIAIIEKITPNEIYATYHLNDHGGHSRSFIKMQEDLSFKVDNARNLLLMQGDSVEIFIEPKRAIYMTFAMFIMPLILFMAFYSISGFIFQGEAELVSILSGVTGIVLSFLGTYWFFKLKPQKLPTVTRKLSSAEAAASCSLASGCGSCSSCSGS